MFDARGVDFDRDGKIGAVDAVRLPPGDCELFNFSLALVGSRGKRFRAKRDFSLPFTIRAGTRTYIREFVAVGIRARRPSGRACFVVSNMADRGIPIARRKQSALPAVTGAVPDREIARHALAPGRQPLTIAGGDLRRRARRLGCDSGTSGRSYAPRAKAIK